MGGRAVVVAAIIVDSLARPTRVMAARRSTPASLAGRWEFPGGKVEPGEAPLDALRRELSEELQLDISVGEEVVSPDRTGWPISDRYVLRAWMAQITRGHPCPTGSHDQVLWLEPFQLANLDWLDADVGVALAVRQRLELPSRSNEQEFGNPFPRQNET